jgi:hypothetical protein
MKLFRNILIGIVATAAILLVVGYAVAWAIIDTKAKDIAVEQATKALDRDVEIASVNFMPFIGVSVKGLEIKDIVSMGECAVSVDAFKSLAIKGAAIGSIDVRELKLIVRKKNDGTIVLPVPPVPTASASAEAKAPAKSDAATSASKPAAKQLPIYLGRLTVVNSSIVYLDDAQPGVTIELPIKKLQVKFFRMPFADKTRFSLSASLRVNGRSADDAIELAGWIDLAKKDMEADLQVKPMDLAMFDPMIPADYQTAQLGLAQAQVALSAIAKAVANELSLTASVTVPNYSFAAGSENNVKAVATKAVLDELKGSEAMVRYEHTFKTKLDAPQFNTQEVVDEFMKKKESLAVGVGTNILNSIMNNAAVGASDKDKGKVAAVSDGVKGLTDALFGNKDGKGPDLQKGLESVMGAISGVENAGKQQTAATQTAQPIETQAAVTQAAASVAPQATAQVQATQAQVVDAQQQIASSQSDTAAAINAISSLLGGASQPAQTQAAVATTATAGNQATQQTATQSEEAQAVQAAANLIGGLFGSAERKN